MLQLSSAASLNLGQSQNGVLGNGLIKCLHYCIESQGSNEKKGLKMNAVEKIVGEREKKNILLSSLFAFFPQCFVPCQDQVLSY